LAAGLVDAVVPAADVECPVRLEVSVVDDGAEPEDGLGSLDSPPGAGDIEAVTIRCRHAPSITPVAIGHPAVSASS
jgi:hypothetical protein